MPSSTRQTIAATPKDIKNNRLGLMSQAQLAALASQIEDFQAEAAQQLRRMTKLTVAVTFALMLLAFVRVVLLPVALVMEALWVAFMLYFISENNRFLQQLTLDAEAQSVRIIKGRTAGALPRVHPLYTSIRVELDSYKLLDATLARHFSAGDLYQHYILPHSGVIIAAERIGEKNALYPR